LDASTLEGKGREEFGKEVTVFFEIVPWTQNRRRWTAKEKRGRPNQQKSGNARSRGERTDYGERNSRSIQEKKLKKEHRGGFCLGES